MNTSVFFNPADASSPRAGAGDPERPLARLAPAGPQHSYPSRAGAAAAACCSSAAAASARSAARSRLLLGARRPRTPLPRAQEGVWTAAKRAGQVHERRGPAGRRASAGSALGAPRPARRDCPRARRRRSLRAYPRSARAPGDYTGARELRGTRAAHTRTHALRARRLPRTLPASRPARSSAHTDAALERPRPCPAPCGHTSAHGNASPPPPPRPHSNAPPTAHQPQRLWARTGTRESQAFPAHTLAAPKTHLCPQAFAVGPRIQAFLSDTTSGLPHGPLFPSRWRGSRRPRPGQQASAPLPFPQANPAPVPSALRAEPTDPPTLGALPCFLPFGPSPALRELRRVRRAHGEGGWDPQPPPPPQPTGAPLTLRCRFSLTLGAAVPRPLRCQDGPALSPETCNVPPSPPTYSPTPRPTFRKAPKARGAGSHRGTQAGHSLWWGGGQGTLGSWHSSLSETVALGLCQPLSTRWRIPLLTPTWGDLQLQGVRCPWC
ncbi:proline-rich protein 36-like [Acinonyx jubatus]|uniref:Proline-rich protein 36-like n=1 Tax=Acinonyx jubatus TaxID=32536 RepID=A0ABM3ND89_ACIJB|nr:proline-rich protein 36-like [Acinonyx jubatus]